METLFSGTLACLHFFRHICMAASSLIIHHSISTNMISISMLNVCSLPSKLDLPNFIQFIESHTGNCFVETKINEIYVDNLSIPAGYKVQFKCRTYCSKVKSGGIRIIYKGQLEEFITEIKNWQWFCVMVQNWQNHNWINQRFIVGSCLYPTRRL